MKRVPARARNHHFRAVEKNGVEKDEYDHLFNDLETAGPVPRRTHHESGRRKCLDEDGSAKTLLKGKMQLQLPAAVSSFACKKLLQRRTQIYCERRQTVGPRASSV